MLAAINRAVGTPFQAGQLYLGSRTNRRHAIRGITDSAVQTPSPRLPCRIGDRHRHIEPETS